MIDKIELRLKPWANFSRTVTTELRRPGTLRQTQHYSGVLDLRPHGFDAMLHYSKRRNDHTHKLEVFETGKKTYSDLASMIGNIVEGDLDPLELTRIDLCADVPNVPVAWFHSHARIRYKQRERRLGPLTSDVICRSHLETLTLGARPNVIRIYDKVSESKARFRTSCRRQSRDADPLDFRQEYGFGPDDVLTRVERQYGGGRLPDTLRTFGMLVNAADTNPFETIELVTNHSATPNIENCEFPEWLKGMQLRREATERGAHGFRRWLNRYSKGNAARWMKTYAAFMPETQVENICMSDILAIYRKSTVAQLAA
jgi:hypothetical protein